MLPTIIGLVGSILCIFAAFHLEQDKPKRLRVSIVAGALLTAIAVAWSAILQDAAQKKIALLTEEISASITGGDSFAFVQFFPESKVMGIIPMGKYPLYDVNIVISDPDKLAPIDIKRATLADVVNRGQRIEIGNLAPNFPQFRWQYDFENKVAKSFFIQVFARNGSFGQDIKYRKISKNTWARAWRVKDIRDSDKVLMEFVDPNFPRNKNGDIDWDHQ